MVDEYITHLWPLLTESTLLFPNRDGKPVDHLSCHVTKLGEKYGITVPTATESWHAAATTVSEEDQQRREAMANMMSHLMQTQQRYYVQMKGWEEAVQEFRIMESLMEEMDPGNGGRVKFSGEEVEIIKM